MEIRTVFYVQFLIAYMGTEIPVFDKAELPQGWHHQDSTTQTHIYRYNGYNSPEIVEVLVVDDGLPHCFTNLEYTGAHILVESVQASSIKEVKEAALELMENADAYIDNHTAGR